MSSDITPTRSDGRQVSEVKDGSFTAKFEGADDEKKALANALWVQAHANRASGSTYTAMRTGQGDS